MKTRNRSLLLFVTLLSITCNVAERKLAQAEMFRGAMLAAEQVTDARLEALKASGTHAVVLQLRDGVDARVEERIACTKIEQAGLQLNYWIEVARCAELADAHPEWMASLQGHPEWRRLFESPPTPRDNEVVKTYPWVPILNEEPFQGQLRRVQHLLDDRPTPQGVFLNDLQGAPSACGCGNHLCRWTSDYGKILTATPKGNRAPADFVAAVQKLLPDAQVIPVWTTECEEHDGAKDGLCAGVGCFKGICWKAYTQQLMPIAANSSNIGVLLPYQAFQRDEPLYGGPADWISHAVTSFQTMPPQHGGQPVAADRLLAVLQGWKVTDKQVARQIEIATKSGVGGYVVSYAEIHQDWRPQIFRWK